jgi:hypothetical protein
MTKAELNQNGFAALESLLILVIIAIIGGTGYFVWHSKSQVNKNLNNAAVSNSSTDTKNNLSSNNPYAGWKTFSAPREKFTLKYPSDWVEASGNNDGQYTLTSPDGLIVAYTYLNTLDQEDGGCGHQSACPKQNILSIDTISPSNHQDIQLIKTAPDENEDCYAVYLNEADAAHKPKVGTNYYDDSAFFYSLKDISGVGRFTVSTLTGFGDKDTFNCKGLSEAEFFNLKSVQQADLILKSISF